MSAIDSFSASKTSVDFKWPSDVTGLERIMLAANGDLQRLLSTFFDQPISVVRVYANTSPRTHRASKTEPITQTRRVRLICAKKTVCVATSSVTVSSGAAERLFLDEKYAVGQVFRKLNLVPAFALAKVGSGVGSNGKTRLWRRYSISAEGFHCDILEVFTDREMFVRGVEWLNESELNETSDDSTSDIDSDIDLVSDVSESSGSSVSQHKSFSMFSDRSRFQVFLVLLTLVLLLFLS